MFSVLRSATASRASIRAFSTTPTRGHDMAKLTLIGRLGKDPELRTSKNDREYVSYTVATTNYPPSQPNPDGSRPEPTVTWHSVVSFNPSTNTYLRTLEKGARVYVEANYEVREPDPTADPASPLSQRQIYLRHENIRVVGNRPNLHKEEGSA